MVTPNLAATRLTAAGTTVVGLTAAGYLIATADPGLAGSVPPHPTLTGSLTDWISILLNNLRVLAAPFLLSLLGFPKTPATRRAGDLLIAALVAINAIPVGLELGRWRSQLLPYLPQLPVEWAALSVAVTAWLTTRRDRTPRHELAILAAITATLLLGAVSLETWATRHRTQSSTAQRPQADSTHGPHLPVRGPELLSPRMVRWVGHVAARSRAPFRFTCCSPTAARRSG